MLSHHFVWLDNNMSMYCITFYLINSLGPIILSALTLLLTLYPSYLYYLLYIPVGGPWNDLKYLLHSQFQNHVLGTLNDCLLATTLFLFYVLWMLTIYTNYKSMSLKRSNNITYFISQLQVLRTLLLTLYPSSRSMSLERSTIIFR